jgi:hypothetical protein
MNYREIKTAEQFLDFMKVLYYPKAGKVERLTVPEMNFISVRGDGEPAAKAYQESIQILYSVAFTLKMGFKFNKLPRPQGYFDYKVPPLEGLWWMDREFDMRNLKEAHWKSMMMVPSFIFEKDFAEAVKQAAVKKPELPFDKVTFERFNEGESIQTMHIGPYAEEVKTISLLTKFIEDNNLELNGKHHEVYLSNPQVAAPEKLKTTIRYPVK